MGDGGGLGPAGRAELGQDVRHVHARRLRRDEQLGGDLAVAVALREQLQDLLLPRGQRPRARRAGRWRAGARSWPGGPGRPARSAAGPPPAPRPSAWPVPIRARPARAAPSRSAPPPAASAPWRPRRRTRGRMCPPPTATPPGCSCPGHGPIRPRRGRASHGRRSPARTSAGAGRRPPGGPPRSAPWPPSALPFRSASPAARARTARFACADRPMAATRITGGP